MLKRAEICLDLKIGHYRSVPDVVRHHKRRKDMVSGPQYDWGLEKRGKRTFFRRAAGFLSICYYWFVPVLGISSLLGGHHF